MFVHQGLQLNVKGLAFSIRPAHKAKGIRHNSQRHNAGQIQISLDQIYDLTQARFYTLLKYTAN